MTARLTPAQVQEIETNWERWRIINDSEFTNLIASHREMEQDLKEEQQRADRLFADRRDLLSVKSTDGLTSSEWIMRTAAAEAEATRLRKCVDALSNRFWVAEQKMCDEAKAGLTSEQRTGASIALEFVTRELKQALTGQEAHDE